MRCSPQENTREKNTKQIDWIHFFMSFCSKFTSVRWDSPGWILQSLEPQFAFMVEGERHFVVTQDLQSEREMPHTDLVTAWRPRKGDGVLRLPLHSQPAQWWGGGKRSTRVRRSSWQTESNKHNLRITDVQHNTHKAFSVAEKGLKKKQLIF